MNYDGIKKLAANLGRPAHTLIALAPDNDPFYITPARQAAAKWFAELWERLGVGAGMHIRRFHYLIVSQQRPVIKVDGAPYENTANCWQGLAQASRDARFLKLVPAKHFVDRKNDEPVIHVQNVCDTDAALGIVRAEPDVTEEAMPSVLFEAIDMPTLPFLHLTAPAIGQRFHIEIWCEKTGANSVLEPLAYQYSCNLITGTGELSAIACGNVVARACASARPVRILYISDFDPAGWSMPIAVARKIEFALRTDGLGLDIQVRPIVLTHEQCRKYRLPRTPIKQTERRIAHFEARFGEGATELDALEALRPGELRKIVRKEIQRYYDAGLDDRVRGAAAEVQDEIDGIEAEIEDEHRDELDALESTWVEIVAEGEALAAEMEARGAGLRAKIEAWTERANPTWHAMAELLQARAPDLTEVEWPEPDEGDEDDDPLFDSTRGYVEQIDKYKQHQGKPTERRPYASRPERLKKNRRHVTNRSQVRKRKRRKNG
jgi:hypothetical protein